MSRYAIALLLALASCSDAVHVPAKSGRFKCESHFLGDSQWLNVVTDTTNGREFLLIYRGGIVEVTK